jgi:hypothetical protein
VTAPHDVTTLGRRTGRSRPVRLVKVNVDGSFHIDDHAASAEAVIRDFEGRFIAESSLYLPNMSSAAAAEAIAMREGLSLAKPFRLQ